MNIEDVRIGMKVRCVDQGPYQYLTKDKIYEVLDIDEKTIYIFDDENDKWHYNAKYFELVEERPEYVRVVTPSGKYFIADKVYKVIEWDGDVPYVVDDDSQATGMHSTTWQPATREEFEAQERENAPALYDVIYIDSDGEIIHRGYYQPMTYDEAVEVAKSQAERYPEYKTYITKFVSKVEVKEVTTTEPVVTEL